MFKCAPYANRKSHSFRTSGNGGVLADMFSATQRGIVELIEETLSKRAARTDGDGEGHTDALPYDDSDFYQQLLRDVIEARGGM